MKERPILFSAPMVRAILAGTKTQTRRVIKPPRGHEMPCEPLDDNDIAELLAVCRYGQPGDRLWVRETWYCDDYRVQQGPYRRPEDWDADEQERMLYFRATDCDAAGRTYTGFSGETMKNPWRPAIHMPRWASRILLEVTDVRVQRLQDISGQDARADGVERIHCYGPECPDGENGCNARGCFGARERFQELWDSINGAGAWGANPWVWALTFQRVAR